jgi:hypothetical protein
MASVCDERKNGQMSGALDRFRQLSLMRRADPADPAGKYLPPFGNEVRQQLAVFEVDVSNLFGAKLADSLAPNRKSPWCWHKK